MRKIKRLVIDIGTNSVLALLADIEGDQLDVIFDKKETTQLGQGLIASNSLSLSAIARTVNAVKSFVADTPYDELIMIGTEALRLASNADDFQLQLKQAVGQRLTIVSGHKEAELSFLGALYRLNVDRFDILQIDVGGGSTELVRAHNDRIESSISIPIGALKLREISRHDALSEYRNEAANRILEHISLVQFANPALIVATGGTITSVAAIHENLSQYDSSKIHGNRLTRQNLIAVAEIFESAPPSERPKLIPFDTQRAELILSGLGIFIAILGIIQRDSLVVSTGGLRFGAALYPYKIMS